MRPASKTGNVHFPMPSRTRRSKKQNESIGQWNDLRVFLLDVYKRQERTQAEFAQFLGISRATVGFYENGERIPDALVLRQIAERCGVATDYLVGLSDMKTTDRDLRAINNITGLSEEALSLIHI